VTLEVRAPGAPAGVADPVAWDVAERVAARLARPEPLAESYLYASLDPDFHELTDRAEELVAAETGLRSARGPARARVIDRPGWVSVNVASFRRLLRPLTDRLASRMGQGRAAAVGRSVAGAEVGALLGWMSTRVLGQYDLLLDEDDHPEDQDVVYYVGPNVLALEKRFGFPPREFRLWLALHEVTHRLQFTGVPWLRDHFLGLVGDSLAELEPDPKRLVDALRRAVDQVRSGDRPFEEGGVMALLATPTQRANLQRIQGLMSVLEGHGELVMNRAGEDLIPSAGRFRQVLHDRRQPRGLAGALQRLVGVEAKLRQYARGQAFLTTIEEASPGAIARLWEDPEYLPTLAEIADPEGWLARTGPAGTGAPPGAGRSSGDPPSPGVGVPA